MNHQVKQRISNRVADYFVVVGGGETLKHISEYDSVNKKIQNDPEQHITYQSDVIDRYPIEDRLDFALPDGLMLFCLPNGLEVSLPHPPSFHSFIHTSEHGAHILGCCLTIYEPLTEKQAASMEEYDRLVKGIVTASGKNNYFVPVCLCLISHWPFVSSFKAFLCGLYRMSLSRTSIPLERVICNFVDEVPSPPAGRVDITYYLGETAISFRCPPSNQPNVWSSMPLFPLFECLSPDNVLALFALVLTERQIILVSSQYSLLTSCAEAVTSLIYPFSWTHAYIPILPRQLLGVLGAPFPFLVGIHASFLGSADCVLPLEAAVINLDKNSIKYGTLGPPPALPERRRKKLHQLILSSASAFEWRGGDWAESRLPLFDSAFTVVTESSAMEAARSDTVPTSSSKMRGDGELSEAILRAGFLNFFVAILKSYRKYLIYGTTSDPDPLIKFRFSEYLSEHPSDWQPFLREMSSTQTFSQFIDERALQSVGGDKLRDVIFFDESIDAKMNRYMFKFRSIDTPFLLDNANLHAKTYVAPTPNVSGLGEDKKEGGGTYLYERFPSLDVNLFSEPRKLPALGHAGQSLAASYQVRLKQSASATAPSGYHLSAVGCVYSCYLVTVSHLICNTATRSMRTRRKSQPPTTQQIIEEFAGPGGGLRSQSVSTVASEGESSFAILNSRIGQQSVSGTGTEMKKIDTDKTEDAYFKSIATDQQQVDQPVSAVVPNEKYYTLLEQFMQGAVDTVLGPSASPEHSSNLLTTSESREISIASPLTIDENNEGKEVEKIIQLITSHVSPLDISRINKMTASKQARRESDSSASVEDEAHYTAAAKLGLKVAFEVLSSLGRLQEAPDDIVYRSLADSCGACGCPSEAIDLLVHMGDEGFLPDNLMLTAVARAFAGEAQQQAATGKEAVNKIHSLTPAEVWTTQDWGKLKKDRGKGSLYLRKRTTGGTITSMASSTPSPSSSSRGYNSNGYNSNNSSNSHKNSTKGGKITGIGGMVNFSVTAITNASGLLPLTPVVKTSKSGLITMNPIHSPEPLENTSTIATDACGSKKSVKNGNGYSSGDGDVDVPKIQPSLSTLSLSVTSPVRMPTVLFPFRFQTHSVGQSIDKESQQPTSKSNTLSNSSSGNSINSNNSSNNNSNNSSQQHSFLGSSGSSVFSSLQSGRWSVSPNDGKVPNLQWKELSSPYRRPAFAISRILNRHMLVAERLLDEAFPGLEINLSDSMGTACPSPTCRNLGRKVMSIGELYRGFSSSPAGAGDPNKYTTRCVHCNFEFVPRFTVRCSTPYWMGSAAGNDRGEEDGEEKKGSGHVLWCELLSPWALRKEMFNVLFQDGVSSLLAEEFHHSSTQHAVVFWNAIIAFRLRGLPYGFLLSDDRISKAFPPREQASPTTKSRHYSS